MQIINYPHPTLRYKSKVIHRVDAELREIVRQMFSLMYEAKGIGLAANQVDMPLRLFIINSEGDPEEGEELVFINPVLSQPEGRAESEEGCLSIPGVSAPVSRPSQIHVEAYNLQGQPFSATLTEILARVVQHENDHLDGVLFIDRVATADKHELEPALDELNIEFQSRRDRGDISGDDQILARRAEFEERYC
ncbi:MAG: peptide deformylase [Pirellulaceae bacterium]